MIYILAPDGKSGALARRSFLFARALSRSGVGCAVATDGGLAPTTFMASEPVVDRAGERVRSASESRIIVCASSRPLFLRAWHFDGVSLTSPSGERIEIGPPVSDFCLYDGAAKFEDTVAYSGLIHERTLNQWKAAAPHAKFLPADTEHEVDSCRNLKRASVAVFGAEGNPPTTIMEAWAAGCVVLTARREERAAHAKNAWCGAADEIPDLLPWLLTDEQRVLRRRLRDAGCAVAARSRFSVYQARVKELLCGPLSELAK